MRFSTKLLLGCWAVGVLSTASYAADYFLQPLEASGSYTIIDNQIVLDGGDQTVTLEIRLDDWNPVGNIGICLDQVTLCDITEPDPCPVGDCYQSNGLLKAYQITIDSSGYIDTLTNFDAFIDTNHPEHVFSGLSQFAIVNTSTDNYIFGSVLTNTTEAPAYAGVDKYCGTLILYVPAGATGSYNVGIVDDLLQTFLRDTNSIGIVPITNTGAIVTIACETNEDCDDDNACTTDTCNPDGSCSNDDNYDNTIYCCNPENGDLTLIDDGNECTEDICNPDGSVDHNNLPPGAPCGSPVNTECDNPDTCDGEGNCQDNLEPPGTPCGDPDESECDHADTCDGAGVCETHIEPPGTPCGDDADTDCTDPDTCDGIGDCLDNNVPDGVECDDGFFCTVDEFCTDGICGGGTDYDCDDGLPCTTDICNDDIDECENTLDEGYCLIEEACYGEGEFNPENDCEECNTGSSTQEWSFRPEGAECDDGNPCTYDDTCDGAGNCEGILDPNCNDTCVDAIAAFEGITLSTNVSAGPVDDAEASCQPDSNHDVWFRYTALCDGEVFMSTTGSEFLPSNDPVLSIYDNCDDLNEIACDDDSGVGLQAALVFDATIDTEYRIRVAGFEDNVGDIVLNVYPVNDCVIDGVCYAEGAINPDNECEACIPELSSVSWSPRPEGAPCGDPSEDECNDADACDGDGVCESNFKPDGTECPDDGNDCTDDVCDTGECAHPPLDFGTPCGDPNDDECDNPDTCDGTGICLDNFEAYGVACGDPSTDQCDDADICDGTGACDPNYKPEGTECDDEDVCTGDDICDGAGGCAGTAIAEAPLVEAVGSKRFQITPLPPGSPGPVALLVTSPDWTCLSKYVAEDGSLTDTPVFQLIDDWGTIFVVDEDVVPDSTYQVQAECGAFVSDAGSATTNPWCDHDGDGFVTIGDVLLSAEAFTGDYSNTTLEVVDVWPCEPNGIINIDDVLWSVNTFVGQTYADTGCPLPCPP
jgi:hypothetical protein